MITRPISQAYERLGEIGQISPDINQRELVDRLDHLSEKLKNHKMWKGRRKALFRRRNWEKPEQGFYIWGGVGRGKTFLMDLFFDSLPEGTGTRLHFHRFMNQVHKRLTALQGTENPLDMIAEEFARKAKVVCFDECFVSDITDAMLLGTLFEALFRRGVALVATSNIEPDALYKDGLQRDHFLPAIELIKKHCDVVNLDSGTDYRLRTLECSKLYYSTCDDQALDAIWASVQKLAPESTKMEGIFVEINRRRIAVCSLADDIVWFDFEVICGPGRAAPDYIEIAKIYHTVVITGVPALSKAGDDMARRFLHLVDEFYDRSVNMIIGANVPLDQLPLMGRLGFEMDRFRSRLLEMQSYNYLERQHRPD